MYTLGCQDQRLESSSAIVDKYNMAASTIAVQPDAALIHVALFACYPLIPCTDL